MPQTVLVTGASVGIGYELAKQFARGKDDLILVARNEEKLRDVAAEMKREFGVGADVMTADLAVAGAAGRLEDQLGGRRVDVLVNNAGFGAIGRFDEIELARQLEMIQVNVTALVDLTHRLLPGMISRGAGGVLNVASTASFQAGPWMAIYYATKAFVLSFSEALAVELRRTGVKVTALCPGPTHSEFRQRAKMEKSPLFKSSPFPVMTAEAVARAGYRGFLRGKRVVIPGVVNRVGVLGAKWMGRGAAARVAGKINRAK
jgi:short-subunit dehydrogenase